MPIGAVIAICVICIIATAIIAVLLVKRDDDAMASRVQLDKVKDRRLEGKLMAEKAAKMKMQAEKTRLASKLKEIADWYDVAKDELDKETQDAYEKLAGDPALLDRELSRILGDETPSS